MMVIPEDLPLEIAPLAWMLGRWQGWGMLAADPPSSADASAPSGSDEATPDSPVVEEVRCDVVGINLRLTTSIYAAQLPEGVEADPLWDANEALSTMTAGDLIWEETAYLRLLPGAGELPPPGEYLPREIRGTGATTSGLGVLWVGVSMGPRVQLVSDAIARDPQALPIEHVGRMYGLVAGEMMWTQERTIAGAEVAVELSGRLARVEEGRTGDGPAEDGPAEGDANE